MRAQSGWEGVSRSESREGETEDLRRRRNVNVS